MMFFHPLLFTEYSAKKMAVAHGTRTSLCKCRCDVGPIEQRREGPLVGSGFFSEEAQLDLAGTNPFELPTIAGPTGATRSIPKPTHRVAGSIRSTVRLLSLPRQVSKCDGVTRIGLRPFPGLGRQVDPRRCGTKTGPSVRPTASIFPVTIRVADYGTAPDRTERLADGNADVSSECPSNDIQRLRGYFRPASPSRRCRAEEKEYHADRPRDDSRPF